MGQVVGLSKRKEINCQGEKFEPVRDVKGAIETRIHNLLSLRIHHSLHGLFVSPEFLWRYQILWTGKFISNRVNYGYRNSFNKRTIDLKNDKPTQLGVIDFKRVSVNIFVFPFLPVIPPWSSVSSWASPGTAVPSGQACRALALALGCPACCALGERLRNSSHYIYAE